MDIGTNAQLFVSIDRFGSAAVGQTISLDRLLSCCGVNRSMQHRGAAAIDLPDPDPHFGRQVKLVARLNVKGVVPGVNVSDR